LRCWQCAEPKQVPRCCGRFLAVVPHTLIGRADEVIEKVSECLLLADCVEEVRELVIQGRTTQWAQQCLIVPKRAGAQLSGRAAMIAGRLFLG
jgi:hypothetical protein